MHWRLGHCWGSSHSTPPDPLAEFQGSCFTVGKVKEGKEWDREGGMGKNEVMGRSGLWEEEGMGK